MWQPATRGDPSDEAFVARCLLGAGWVGANRKLSMVDLRVWAALCALLREQETALPPDDPDPDRASVRTVQTTGYRLADMVFGDGGGQYGYMTKSLLRLSSARMLLQRVERDVELAMQRVSSGSHPLIGELRLETTLLDHATPREWGKLKGSSTLKVEIGQWTAQQALAGKCTWLDLDLLRARRAALYCSVPRWGCSLTRPLDSFRGITARGAGAGGASGSSSHSDASRISTASCHASSRSPTTLSPRSAAARFRSDTHSANACVRNGDRGGHPPLRANRTSRRAPAAHLTTASRGAWR